MEKDQNDMAGTAASGDPVQAASWANLCFGSSETAWRGHRPWLWAREGTWDLFRQEMRVIVPPPCPAVGITVKIQWVLEGVWHKPWAHQKP